MQLGLQKRMAAQLKRCSEKRVVLDQTRLSEIKEAITKTDIRALIDDKAITIKPVRGVSRARARKTQTQKSKGLRKGSGKRKGKQTAREPSKERWMKHVRLQREFLKELREKKLITNASYRELYGKSRGGFFRSRRHLKLYINEKGMLKK